VDRASRPSWGSHYKRVGGYDNFDESISLHGRNPCDSLRTHTPRTQDQHHSTLIIITLVKMQVLAWISRWLPRLIRVSPDSGTCAWFETPCWAAHVAVHASLFDLVFLSYITVADVFGFYSGRIIPKENASTNKTGNYRKL
jgi:hypothetical protein